MFQITQTAMNDSGGAACGTGGEVMLLEQEGATADAGALTGNGNAVNAAADYYGLKVLAFQRLPVCAGNIHFGHTNLMHGSAPRRTGII
jgi:hypothetical protein